MLDDARLLHLEQLLVDVLEAEKRLEELRKALRKAYVEFARFVEEGRAQRPSADQQQEQTLC